MKSSVLYKIQVITGIGFPGQECVRNLTPLRSKAPEAEKSAPFPGKGGECALYHRQKESAPAVPYTAVFS